MAILFSQADGSDQHYDTYEEFEQAFVLLKRLNGEKVPQDLLDEVKAKYGDKDPKPFQVKIDGNNFESAFRAAVRDVGEELGNLSKDRTPISDECEIPRNGPKFKIGDQVKVVDNTSKGHVEGTTGEITGVRHDEYENRWTYEVRPISDYEYEYRLSHRESDLNTVTDSTEFRMGDLVKVLETFDDNFGDVARVDTIQEVVTKHDKTVLGVGRVLIGDNHDKLRLVCRKEDRKDIGL